MTYTALSSIGPRIALAISEDLLHWKRIGPARFEPYRGIDLGNVNSKDASVFPIAIRNHAGKLQSAMLHRPLFPGTLPEDKVCEGERRLFDLEHERIWISYCQTPADDLDPPDRFDVYYGMADSRIGVARLELPECLPDRPKQRGS
jgi:predicted GH43/DUF377 family glycosyl hydrolase